MRTTKRDLLKSWAGELAKIDGEIFQAVQKMAPLEIVELKAVVDSLTTTNCWWAEYHLRDYVKSAIYAREQALSKLAQREAA